MHLTFYFLSIILVLVLVLLVSFKFNQILFCFVLKEETSKVYLPVEKISLKGRMKRCPENINYKELFTDEVQNKKNKKTKQEKKEESENFYNFVNRVNERNNFDKMFSGPSKTISQLNNINEIFEISKTQTCLEKPKKDGPVVNLVHNNYLASTFSNLKNLNEVKITQSKPEIKNTDLINFKFDKSKSPDTLEKILTNEAILNIKSGGENNESVILDSRLNNSGLYTATPLARIRINSLVKN